MVMPQEVAGVPQVVVLKVLVEVVAQVSSTVQVEAGEAQEEMKMEPQEEGVLVEEDVLMIIQLEEQDLQKQVKL